MKNMLERIARELRAMTIRNGGRCRGDEETGWRDYVDDARQLLRAMSVSSWAMNDAVFEQGEDVMHPSGDRVQAEVVWAEMINAALRDEPK